jgi:hypothetical protein
LDKSGKAVLLMVGFCAPHTPFHRHTVNLISDKTLEVPIKLQLMQIRTLIIWLLKPMDKKSDG